MYSIEDKKIIVATGLEMLDMGLVARTWGNASCKIEGSKILISPSGLDYALTEEEDIPVLDLDSEAWEGRRRPSSEKAIHIATYEHLPNVNFAIHTHQLYGTMLGLSGLESIDITADEEKLLGGLAVADYGLPASIKLVSEVSKALAKGKHTILMRHHGVLSCGKDKEEAMERLLLLEKICKRNARNQHEEDEISEASRTRAAQILSEFEGELINAGNDELEAVSGNEGARVRLLQTKQTIALSLGDENPRAQLDDAAQMLGSELLLVDDDMEVIKESFGRNEAVLIKGVGALFRATNEDELEALSLLIQKAAMCRLHTKSWNLDASLDIEDCEAMRKTFLEHYSKLKTGN